MKTKRPLTLMGTIAMIRCSMLIPFSSVLSAHDWLLFLFATRKTTVLNVSYCGSEVIRRQILQG